MVTCKVGVAVEFATKCCSWCWERCVAVGAVCCSWRPGSRLLQVLCFAAGAAGVVFCSKVLQLAVGCCSVLATGAAVSV